MKTKVMRVVSIIAALCLAIYIIDREREQKSGSEAESTEVDLECSLSISTKEEELGLENNQIEKGEIEQNNKLPVQTQDNVHNKDYFSIIKKIYEQKEDGLDIEIFYPQLQGMEDAEKEERINQLIEVEAQRLIPKRRGFSEECIEDGYVMCVFLDYEIQFLNSNIISILYKGMNGCIVKGLDGAVMATTIDLNTEEIIKLSDIITDMEKLCCWLLSDRFQGITLWEGVASNSLLSEEYKNERKVWLMDALNGISEEHAYIEWYTDGMNLVIVSTSPYGMEDYNEYAASLESVQNVISQVFLKKLSESFRQAQK